MKTSVSLLLWPLSQPLAASKITFSCCVTSSRGCQERLLRGCCQKERETVRPLSKIWAGFSLCSVLRKALTSNLPENLQCFYLLIQQLTLKSQKRYYRKILQRKPKTISRPLHYLTSVSFCEKGNLTFLFMILLFYCYSKIRQAR